MTLIHERWYETTKDRIPPVDNEDEYGRGIPDEERERRFVDEEEETVSISISISQIFSFIYIYVYSII
jgi:hypothetical protein